MSSSNDTNEYASAMAKGNQFCEILRELNQDDAQHKHMTTMYKVEAKPLRTNVEDSIRDALVGTNLSIGRLRYVEVSSQHRAKNVDVAYTNYIDGDNGIIVCSENYKDRDSNPDGHRLWPSEILWQSWAMESQTQRFSQSALNAILRLCVVNHATKKIIWQAMQSSTASREESHYHREYTEVDEGYYAILGSPNSASTMRMLINHKAAIGHRTVERIVVLGDNKVTLEGPESRSVLLLLTPCRP